MSEQDDGDGRDEQDEYDQDEYEDRQTLYLRVLRVRNIQPAAWQRLLLAEGSVILAVLIVLADLASAWLLVVLPVLVAGGVVYHDLLEGLLRRKR